MEHQLASERTTRLQSENLGIGRLGPRRMLAVPEGTCHAMPIGGSVAACGRTGLILWAQPWARGAVTRCEQCLEIVPVADPAAAPADQGDG